MVRDGAVTDDAWEAMASRMTQRGAVEYAIFIMFLATTIRLIETFTGTEHNATAQEIDEMLADTVRASSDRRCPGRTAGGLTWAPEDGFAAPARPRCPRFRSAS